MFGGSKSFEVLVRRDGKWAIEATAASQEHAEQAATQLIGRAGVEGVRVVRETGQDLQNIRDSAVLFERIRQTAAPKSAIGEIAEAPDCDSPSDMTGANGRRTINRLFRSYLDQNSLTASEVMHVFKEMKRALDNDTMIPNAVAKVAQLQTRGREDISANQRRDELFDFINQLTDKAKHAQKVKLPRASREGFDTMLDAAINGSAEPTPEQIYFLKVGISRDLVDTRNWWGKFQQLVEWAAPCQREAGLATLDGFISDALANPDLLRDMLGPQSDLAGALGSLVDFAKGDVERLRFPEQFSKEQQEFAPAHLNALMQRGALPDSAGTLLDRVCRQLDSAAPLARGDEAEQNEAFKGFLDKVLPDLDVLGGGDMAVALTNRQSRLLNKGGAAGLKEATSRIMPTLGDPGRKCAYLLSLAESRLGQDVLASDVQQHLDALLLNPNSVNAIVTDKLPPNRKMEKVTSIFYKIRDSALPDERKTKLVERLDELLASYIVEDKILDKLDNPDRPLHIRAFMLVSMCQPTMLPRGKAAKLAQQIIIRHLRRPNFEEELVSAIPEAAEKERILRKFHEELARSGFFG